METKRRGRPKSWTRKLSDKNTSISTFVTNQEIILYLPINNVTKSQPMEFKHIKKPSTNVPKYHLGSTIIDETIAYIDGRNIVVSDILCWWCKSNVSKYHIPERMIDNKFIVFGYFCSLECACAFNYQLNDNRMNSRHILLQHLYKNNNIKPAPDWTLLKKFGGTLSIENFMTKTI